jgi:hypothetical protein
LGRINQDFRRRDVLAVTFSVPPPEAERRRPRRGTCLPIWFRTCRNLIKVAAFGNQHPKPYSRGSMRFLAIRRLALLLAILSATALAGPALAQQPPAAAPAAPPAAKPAPKPAAPKPAAPKPPPAARSSQPTLLGQYGDWGAYTASPGGKKICFAIAKPSSSQTIPPNRPRNPPYLFIASRPAEKVKDEVSVVIGYPFKPNSEATAEVGSTTFALYTKEDGAWIKNAGDEAKMIEAMRGGQSVVVKGVSGRGTQTVDTFSLRGLSQALDRVGQECK